MVSYFAMLISAPLSVIPVTVEIGSVVDDVVDIEFVETPLMRVVVEGEDEEMSSKEEIEGEDEENEVEGVGLLEESEMKV